MLGGFSVPVEPRTPEGSTWRPKKAASLPGDLPVFVELTANVGKAAPDIRADKRFDNAAICAYEQSVVVAALAPIDAA